MTLIPKSSTAILGWGLILLGILMAIVVFSNGHGKIHDGDFNDSMDEQIWYNANGVSISSTTWCIEFQWDSTCKRPPKALRDAVERDLKPSDIEGRLYPAKVCMYIVLEDWACMDRHIEACDPGMAWYHRCPTGWHYVTGGTCCFFECGYETACGHTVPFSVIPTWIEGGTLVYRIEHTPLHYIMQ